MKPIKHSQIAQRKRITINSDPLTEILFEECDLAILFDLDTKPMERDMADSKIFSVSLDYEIEEINDLSSIFEIYSLGWDEENLEEIHMRRMRFIMNHRRGKKKQASMLSKPWKSPS